MNIAQDRPPNHLYKYRWFDKNRIDGAPYQRDRSIIVDCALWAGSPLEFNDPFDCYPVTDFQGTDEEIEAWATIVAPKYGALIPYTVNKIKSALDNPETREQLEMNTWRDNVKALGVVSLTERPDDMLMWAHYANSHQGYCLELDATVEPLSLAWSVSYTKERPVFKFFDPKRVDSIERTFLNKAEFWQHEREWRIVRPAEQGPVVFPQAGLKSIIFGAAIEKQDEDALRAIAAERETPVSFKRARLHQSNYQVEIVEA